eukprot:10992337-Alexandrium_andersonii.AAC.1
MQGVCSHIPRFPVTRIFAFRAFAGACLSRPRRCQIKGRRNQPGQRACRSGPRCKEVGHVARIRSKP